MRFFLHRLFFLRLLTSFCGKNPCLRPETFMKPSFELALLIVTIGFTWQLATLVCQAQTLQMDPQATEQTKKPYLMPSTQTQQNTQSQQNPYLLDTPSESMTTDSGSSFSRKPLQASITKSRFLPKDMYGRWSVTATLIRTNLPQPLTNVVHDIWNLTKDGEMVFISNPVSGAEASISVDKVVGQTATFHHQVVIRPGKEVMIEQPTVTVAGSRLFGKTQHTFLKIRDGQVVRRYIALFDIEAKRLGEDTARLQPEQSGPLEFEIADIQDERQPASNIKSTTANSSLYDW